MISTNSSNKLIIAIIPNVFGFTGDAVNERQLVKYLCKNSKCIVFSFIGISKLLRLRKLVAEVYEEGWGKNIVLMPIPSIPPYTVFTLIVLLLITSFIWVLDRFAKIRLIYVRSSILALGVTSIKSLARRACVKIPAIVEDEVLRWRRIISFIYNLTDRYVLSRAGAIGVPSPLLLKKLIVRRRVLQKGKIVLIPAGIDREKIEALKEYPINHNTKGHYIIGFIGYLEWWQGVDILVKAVAKIKNLLDKPVKLLIVGDGTERRKIETLCKELNVHCGITGFVKHEEALKLLKTFDALVVPSVRISTTESNIPIKILEAWALGVPVIVTRHEIFAYLGLKEGKDIIFCEPHPEDVANKILILIKDNTLRKILIDRGRQLVKGFYYDKIALNIVNAMEVSRDEKNAYS
jgi:glycosyltransferase involved in cell wall biosynthesis